MSADKIALRDRCRVKDLEHVSYLEHIAAKLPGEQDELMLLNL
jgi:hypothetical protein